MIRRPHLSLVVQARPDILPFDTEQLLPQAVLFVELLLVRIQTHRLTIDEHQIDVSLHVQRVYVGDDEVRSLPFFNRAEPIGDSKDLGYVQGHGFVCFFLRQARMVPPSRPGTEGSARPSH